MRLTESYKAGYKIREENNKWVGAYTSEALAEKALKEDTELLRISRSLNISSQSETFSLWYPLIIKVIRNVVL